MIRVVHIQLESILSGAQKVCLDEMIVMSNLVDDIKYSVVVKEDGVFTEKAKDANSSVELLPDLTREITIHKDLIALFKLTKILKDIEPDIIHTHSSKPGVLGRLVGKFLGIPVVHTVHGFAFPGASSLLKRLIYYYSEMLTLKLNAKVIVLTKSDKDIVLDMGVSGNNIAHLPNAVNLAADLKIRAPRSAKVENIRVLLLGRLEDQKNPTLLIKALRQLDDSVLNAIKIEIVGDGSLRRKMEHLVTKFGFTSIVTFHGWVDDPTDILNRCDVYINSSNWEGMSLSVLEAMAAGLCCICSNIPSNAELIESGHNGFLFQKEDQAELATYLTHLSKHREQVIEIGINAQRYILENHNLNERVHKIKKIYSGLVRK